MFQSVDGPTIEFYNPDNKSLYENEESPGNENNNKGNINILGNKKDIYVGGISGYIKSLGLVNSVYNSGNIKGNNINIGSGIGLLDTSKVIVYSLSSNANNIIGSGISNDSNIFTKSYMKSKEFLNLLNTEENKWDIDSNINNGFPYLKELKRQ